jgi:OOP family OmpA-OmpF porin
MPQPNEVMTEPVVEGNETAETKISAPQESIASARESSSESVSNAGSETKPALLELRQILLGEEADRWRELQARIENTQQRARDVGQVLPKAINSYQEDKKQLTQALTPTVEDAIEISARTNTQKLSDALYPVIGPAIRAAVSHAINSMVQSLNSTLNNSLSPQGLKWRLEAWQTGKSFGEVVLLKTLKYRVEQVFLIHKETSLLLLQMTAPAVTTEDPQLVSSMLTAIQMANEDFARDSFRVGKGESLEKLDFGPVDIWMVTGPLALLAAGIRGEPHEDLRPLFHEVLENIHRDQGLALSEFKGETTADFETCRPELERCLQSQLSENQTTKKGLSPVLVLVPLLVLALLGWWLYSTITENRQWQRYLTRLQAEPGLVVVQAERYRDGFHISGLRDPLAADPSEILKGYFPPERVSQSRWEPYLALTPEMIQRRAQSVLQPPDSMQLSFANGILAAKGTASPAWMEEAPRLARVIPGVTSFQFAASALQQIPQIVIEFPAGSAQLEAEGLSHVEKLATLMRQAISESASAQNPVFELIGSADSSGSTQTNQRLRQQRAETVKAALVGRGIEASQLRTASDANHPNAQLRCVKIRLASGQ